ncbi:MAG: DUF2490 domain-containing protein, partial [Chitinophagia bacterium]|nr:DUF2490 domain-containing protein [Chitinophagia bacterium]
MKGLKILICITILGTAELQAQATRTDPIDVQGWFGAGLDFDLPKKWQAGIEYQSRVENNVKTLKGSYYSFSLEKEIVKHITVLGQYRLSKVQGEQFSRFGFGLTLDKKLGKIKTDLRFLYQNKQLDLVDPINREAPNNYLRARLRARKELSKELDLIASFEPIYRVQQGVKIDNYRIQGGVRLHFNKAASLDIFYLK